MTERSSDTPQVNVRVIGLDEIRTLEPGENPRQHNPPNIGLIEQSIHEVGFMRPGVIDEDGVVWAGNGATDAAIKAGYTRAVVIETDGDVAVYHQRRGLSPVEKLWYAIEDNQATLTSSWDLAFMRELALHDREVLTGIFQPPSIDAFLTEIQDADARARQPATKYKTEHDAVRVRPGELWRVGPHRLICGDATDARVIARLMGGRRAVGIFTSPPYAEQRAGSYASVAQDEYVDWWGEAQVGWVTEGLTPNGSLFLNLKAHVADGQRQLYAMKLVIAMVESWDWRFVDEFCWKKQGYPGDYDNRFKNAWEPVYHFARTRDFKARVKNVAEARRADIGAWYGPLADAQGRGGTVTGKQVETVQPDNVLEIGIDATGVEGDTHPARFPVALPEFFLRAFSDAGDIWLDPFLGSGSTLVAGARCGRMVYGADLDPAYLETVLRRAEADGITDIQRLEEAPDAES